MKTKFRVFTALLLALMVLVSVLPLQAAAEIGQSGTATRAEAENTAEAALSVKPMLTLLTLRRRPIAAASIILSSAMFRLRATSAPTL